MINLHWLYVLAGAVFAAFAIGSALDVTNPKRWGNAIFWGLLAISFWFGDFLGDLGNGVLMLALVGIAGFHLLSKGSKASTTIHQRASFSERYGNRLFLPALVIPFTAFVGTLLFNYTALKDSGLIDPKSVTLVLLGVGVILALAICYAWLKPAATAPFEEGRRLMDSIGWAAVLPQMLASLGAVFAAAGVGTAIGVPILIQQDGGNPAAIGAVGMLSGFCGTLMTPMAANFNIVPAALLELKNQYGVVRVQIPTAIPLLIANILILYFAALR